MEESRDIQQERWDVERDTMEVKMLKWEMKDDAGGQVR